MEIKLMGLKTQENLRKFILKNGAYENEENERIYRKYFKPAPRYIFKAINKKYRFVEGSVADVGCGFAQPLVFCGEGSYGVDIDVTGRHIPFAESLGLKVYKKDIINDSVTDLPKVDSVFNAMVMEHVDSPHILLRKMWQILKPDGTLFLYVPTIPLLPFLGKIPKVGKFFVGHLHTDHVNAFTPRTVRFTCEHAGFETIELSHFYPGPFKIFNWAPFIDGVVYVGRKKENWEYPKDAHRRKADNNRGFYFFEQETPNN